MMWQPIETAPKGGYILLYTPNPSRPVREGFWSQKAVWAYVGESLKLAQENPPTHWMPLPSPPGYNVKGGTW